jgi:hypothetical protein
LLTAAALVAPGRTAAAQDPALVDKLVGLNKKAIADFETLEWDAAKRSLIEALNTAKKAGLDNHPVVARTYVHLGAVYIAGFHDRKKGTQSFERALDLDPGIQLSKSIATSDVKEVFAQVQGRRAPAAAVDERADAEQAPPKRRRAVKMESDADADEAPASSKRRSRDAESDDSDEPDLPVRINALDCPNKDETILEKPAVVRCAVAPTLAVDKVFLMYRDPANGNFATVEMAKTPKGWHQAKIPAKAVTGKSLQFYFEGRNAADKPVVANGRKDSPNVMLIVEEGAAQEATASRPRPGAKAREEDENPLDEPGEVRGPKIFLGRVDKSRIGLDVRYGKRKWWIGLAAGSGWGYAKGDGLEARYDLQGNFAPGFGWANLGHLAPEVGYQITPDFAVSIQSRHQWIPQSEYAKFTAHGAHSVLARVLVFTKQARFRLFGSAMAGGGEGFRFILYPDDTRPGFKDTVRGGPGIGGLGGGAYFELSRPLSLVLEANALAGFPTFSFVTDINLGIQLNIY